MTARKFYAFNLNDATPDDYTGHPGEITYRDGYLYYHDGETAGGEVIGGGGSGGPTSWSTVTGKPSFAAVATSGAYADLTGKPALFSGSYVDLTGKPNFATVATSGSYVDLTNKPSLFSGAYADLTGKPTLFSGSYTDLTDKPTIPTSFSSLVNGAYTVSLSTTGQLNLPSAANTEGNNARIQSANSIDILSNLSKWTFGTDGDLTFPDSTVQSTAWTGNVSILVNGASNVNIATANEATTITRGATTWGPGQYAPPVTWTFGSGPTKTALTVPGYVQGPGQTGFINSDKWGLSIDSGNTPASISLGLNDGSADVTKFFWGGGSKNGILGDVEIRTINSGGTPTSIILSPQGGVNGSFNFGGDGDLTLPSGLVFDRAHTSIRVGQGFHIASGEGVNIRAIDETDPNNLIYKNWIFRTDGSLLFPDGASLYNDDDGINLGGYQADFTDKVIQLVTNSTATGEHVWRFDETGVLSIPVGGDIVDSTGASVLGGGTTLPADASGYLVNDGSGALSWAAGDGTFSGDYNDLTNKPTIPTDVSDLTDATNLLFSGSYTDLTDKPTIPTSFSSLVNGSFTASLDSNGELSLPTNAYTEAVIKELSATALVLFAQSTGGNIKLLAGATSAGSAKQWLFNGTDGKLTAPGNLQVDGGKIILNSAGNAYVESVDYGVNSANSAVNIFGGPYQKIKLRAGFGTEATWTFDTSGDLTAPRNIILNNPVTTVTTSVTGTVADSNGNPFTFRILKADNPQLITPFADPNFVLKWTGGDAGSAAAAAQAPGGQGPSSLVSDDGTYWNFNSWFGLNTSRPNSGTVFTVEYGVVVSDTMISTTATNLIIEADTEQWKFGTDGVLTLPDNSVISSYKPVTVIAGPTGVQTISDNASATRLTFIESVDSVGAFTNSTFTVPYTGYYQFNTTVYFTSDVTLTDGFLIIAKTTSGINELDALYYGAFSGRVINGSSMQYLTAGDTVALFFRQVSGNVVDIGSSSRLTIHRVSIS